MKGIERIILSNDLITTVFIIGFILLFLMKVFNAKFLKGYSTAFFTKGFIEDVAEQRPKLFGSFFSLIRLFCILIISLTIYLIYTLKHSGSSSTLFLSILTFVLIYYLVKNSFIIFATNIFDVKQELNYLIFTKNGYLYNVCLWLFPVLVLYQYCYPNYIFLTTSISFLLIFRLFLVLFNNKSIVFRHLFYFILYFCTLEIAPLLLIYKTIELI